MTFTGLPYRMQILQAEAYPIVHHQHPPWPLSGKCAFRRTGRAGTGSSPHSRSAGVQDQEARLAAAHQNNDDALNENGRPAEFFL